MISQSFTDACFDHLKQNAAISVSVILSTENVQRGHPDGTTEWCTTLTLRFPFKVPPDWRDEQILHVCHDGSEAFLGGTVVGLDFMRALARVSRSVLIPFAEQRAEKLI